MSGPVVTLSWAAPTSNTDGSALIASLTYNVYQGSSATTLAKVQSALTAPTATISSGLTAGTTQYFAVTSVENGVESTQTTPVSIAIPQPVPNAPTALTAGGVGLSGVETSHRYPRP